MPPRKQQSIAPQAERVSTNIALPDRSKTSGHIETIPNGEWVGGYCIDAQNNTTSKGNPCVDYQFSVTSPRLYAGVTLYFTLHEGLDKSLNTDDDKSLASQFPGVNLMDADAAWSALQGKFPLRIHVGHRQYTDTETGEVRVGYRVASFRPDSRKLQR